jgi:DnaJ-domain-containing protein 1
MLSGSNTTLEQRRANLIGYMRMKIDAADWHAVADAAMDLRELEVEIRLEPQYRFTVAGNAAAGNGPSAL